MFWKSCPIKSDGCPYHHILSRQFSLLLLLNALLFLLGDIRNPWIVLAERQRIWMSSCCIHTACLLFFFGNNIGIFAVVATVLHHSCKRYYYCYNRSRKYLIRRKNGIKPEKWNKKHVSNEINITGERTPKKINRKNIWKYSKLKTNCKLFVFFLVLVKMSHKMQSFELMKLKVQIWLPFFNLRKNALKLKCVLCVICVV